MSKREQLELLDLVVERLNKMPVQERHLVIIGLLAWHISSAPEGQQKQAAAWIGKSAVEMLDNALKLKETENEASDLRH